MPPSLPSSLSLSRSLFSGVSSDGRSYRASLKGFHGPSRTKVYHRQWNNFFSRIEHDRADTHLMSSCTTATVAPDAKEGSSGSYSAVVRKVGWSVGGHLLPPLSLAHSPHAQPSPCIRGRPIRLKVFLLTHLHNDTHSVSRHKVINLTMNEWSIRY